jgi:glycolate oxidase iron-sulfur subunit
LLLQQQLGGGRQGWAEEAMDGLEASGGEPVAPEILEAFDLCLGCRACETTCPSGVSFELLEHAKELAFRERRPRGPLPLRWFTSRRWLRTLRRNAGPVRGILRGLLGPQWRARLEAGPLPGRRLGRWLGSMPRSVTDDRELVALLDRLQAGGEASAGRSGAATPGVGKPLGEGGAALPRIAFFAGCANDALLPATSRRLREVLRWSGYPVVELENQACCGAFDRHAGRPGPADRKRERNRRAILRDEASWDLLVVEAAGCSLELKEYPEEVAATVRDANVLLAESASPALRQVRLQVALHEPCHARHGQGIAAEPRELLARIPGLELCLPEEADVCCGSGGPYALLHPDLATNMGRRKATVLAETGADLVVTSNPGCLGQIVDGLALIGAELPVLPLSDLLWYAARPPGR